MLDQKPWRYDEAQKNTAFSVTTMDTGTEVVSDRLNVYCSWTGNNDQPEAAVVTVTDFAGHTGGDGWEVQAPVTVLFDGTREATYKWYFFMGGGKLRLSPSEPKSELCRELGDALIRRRLCWLWRPRRRS